MVELVPSADGRLEERPAPQRLASRTVTLIDVYGSLHYAGARTLQHHLPDPAGTESPAVVLRMRGRTTLGVNLLHRPRQLRRQLDAVGGRLYVAGLDPALIAQARRTGTIPADGPVKLYEASPVIGESSLAAFHDAQAWVCHTTTRLHGVIGYTETLIGKVAIQAAVPMKTRQPTTSSAFLVPAPRSLVLMPAKNRATANRTTAST